MVSDRRAKLVGADRRMDGWRVPMKASSKPGSMLFEYAACEAT